MVSSILIILFSLVLLIYWFRYSCMLLLRNRMEAAVSVRTVKDSRFSFGAVQEQLKTAEALDPLHRSLQRDYEVFVYLVEHASGLSLESFEDRLLRLDYRIMQGRYDLTKRMFPRQARLALSEMASIMAILVGRMSEQAGVQVEA